MPHHYKWACGNLLVPMAGREIRSRYPCSQPHLALGRRSFAEAISLLKLFPSMQNHFLVVSQDTLSIDARSKGDSRRIRQGTRCLHPMQLGNIFTSVNWVALLPCCQGLYSNLPSSASCKRQPRGQLLCAVPAARVHSCCFRLLLRAGGPRLDWLLSISAGRATMQK